MVSLVNTTIGDDPAIFTNEVSGSTPQGEGREASYARTHKCRILLLTHTPLHPHTHTSTPSHACIIPQGEVTPTGAKHWSVAQFMTPDKVTASHHDSSLAQTPPSHKEIHNVGLMTVECFLGVSQVSSVSYDELELHITVLGTLFCHRTSHSPGYFVLS